MGALDGGVWLDAVQHESLMTSYKCRQQDMISWPMVRQQVRHRRRIGTSLSCMSRSTSIWIWRSQRSFQESDAESSGSDLPLGFNSLALRWLEIAYGRNVKSVV